MNIEYPKIAVNVKRVKNVLHDSTGGMLNVLPTTDTHSMATNRKQHNTKKINK